MTFKRQTPQELSSTITKNLGKAKPLIALAVGVFIVIVIFFSWDSVFGYVLHPIQATEIGIKFRAGQPYDVVGPGMYTEPGFFEDIKSISIKGLPFRVIDPEVLTHDKQRLGVEVSGTVHRPGLDKKKALLENWASYSIFYTSDEALAAPQKFDKDGKVIDSGGLINSLSQQAMKVCAGDLNFDDAIIGSARDVLKECINKELDLLAVGYGLEVRNVVVPSVLLGADVQKTLDEITQARLSTQLANQKELQAKAEADRDKAIEAGKITVEQGRIQEKSRQDAITAELNRKALEAQNAVIEADKKNQLLTANRNKEIADIDRQTAEINAKATLAAETAKAEMLSRNPAYVELQKIQALSGAYSKTDKMIVIPSNVNPYLFLGETPQITVPASTK
jgi:hypothetical protein